MSLYTPSLNNNQSATHKKRSGFTLIEFMIVTTLGILLMLTASSVLMTILVGRAKSSTQQRLKAEGDYAMSQMEFAIRNAVKLLPTPSNPSITCSSTQNIYELYVQSSDGSKTLFRRLNGVPPDTHKIAAVKDGVTTLLTSSAVAVTTAPSFNCVENLSSGNRYITISFRLAKNNISQVFTSSVNMRNY